MEVVLRLQITARHFDLIEPVKEFAEGKIIPLTRFHNHLTQAHLVLMPEGKGYKSDLTVSGKNINFYASAEANNLNSAIEDVTTKIERQLKENKDRIKKSIKQPRKPME